jgi:HK97 family phage portal protein
MFTRLRNWFVRTITWDQAARVGLVTTPTASGVTVTLESALTSSPVFAAVRIISTAISTLPLTVYRRQQDGSREKATGHPAYRILHDEPNPESDPAVWWAAFVARVLLQGNGFAEIERNRAGEPIALWLIPSERVRIETAGGLVYHVETDSGQVALTPDEMFHVPYLTLDGVCGKGIIQYARECVGLNKAMETGAASQFANMVRPAGVLELPIGMSDDAKKNLKESIERQNTGAGKVGRILPLESGVKFTPFGLSNQDAQWIEGRGFGVQEVARFFSISPTKLGDLGRATWSNIGAENLSFIENTLRAILVPIEQQARRKLLTSAERESHYVEAVIEARLRGLTKDRYDAYKVGTAGRPFLLPSEVRRMENLPAAPELDKLPTSPEPEPTPKPEVKSDGNPDATDPAQS